MSFEERFQKVMDLSESLKMHRHDLVSIRKAPFDICSADARPGLSAAVSLTVPDMLEK
jgi:hypothetical protein